MLCTDLGSREIMSCRVVVVERHPDSARRCGYRGHGRGLASGSWGGGLRTADAMEKVGTDWEFGGNHVSDGEWLAETGRGGRDRERLPDGGMWNLRMASTEERGLG